MNQPGPASRWAMGRHHFAGSTGLGIEPTLGHGIFFVVAFHVIPDLRRLVEQPISSQPDGALE